MIIVHNKVIKIVENIYLWVLMSVKFWWILLKNFLVYGVAAALNGEMLFFTSKDEERVSHQKLNSDTKFNLKYSKLISLITSFMVSIWIACAIFIAKTHLHNTVLGIIFWICAAWSVLLLTYLVELGLVNATQDYEQDKSYYIQAFIYFVRQPQLTITIAVLWVVLTIFIIKNAVIAIFIMPGLIGAITARIYRGLVENQKINIQN